MMKKEEFERYHHVLEARYQKASRLRGMQQCHSFVPINGTEAVEVRKYSSAVAYEKFEPFKGNAGSSLHSAIDFTIGSIVAVLVNPSFQLIALDEEQETISISFMKRTRQSNQFSWPEPPKIEEVHWVDVLSTIDTMLSLPNVFYAFRGEDLNRNNRLKRIKMKTVPQ